MFYFNSMIQRVNSLSRLRIRTWSGEGNKLVFGWTSIIIGTKISRSVESYSYHKLYHIIIFISYHYISFLDRLQTTMLITKRFQLPTMWLIFTYWIISLIFFRFWSCSTEILTTSSSLLKILDMLCLTAPARFKETSRPWFQWVTTQPLSILYVSLCV